MMDEPANDTVDLKSLDYINVNDYLLCPICKSAFVKPVTTVCGHTFCAACLHRAIGAGGGQCPIDRRILNPDKDITRAPRIISNMADELVVHCPFSKECSFQGPRGLIQAHMDEDCDYRKVPCTCSSDEMILKCQLAPAESCPHKVKQCPHCSEGIPILEMASHESECPSKVMTECPECGIEISASAVKDHLDTVCPHVTVQCTGASLGCTWEGYRTDLKTHNHTCLESKLATTLNSQQEAIFKVTEENTRLKTQLDRVLVQQATLVEDRYDPSTDYSLQAFTENEHLRRDLDRLHRSVADLEIRSNVLVMNESCRSKDEMQALWAAINGLRHQIHFLLSERRIMQHHTNSTSSSSNNTGLQQQQPGGALHKPPPPPPPPPPASLPNNAATTHQVRTVKL